MIEQAIQGGQVDAVLDVRGLDPAESFQRARVALEKLSENRLLELTCDEDEVLRRLPYALRAEGHEILVSEPASPGVRLILRKRSLLPAE